LAARQLPFLGLLLRRNLDDIALRRSARGQLLRSVGDRKVGRGREAGYEESSRCVGRYASGGVDEGAANSAGLFGRGKRVAHVIEILDESCRVWRGQECVTQK